MTLVGYHPALSPCPILTILPHLETHCEHRCVDPQSLPPHPTPGNLEQVGTLVRNVRHVWSKENTAFIKAIALTSQAQSTDFVDVP
jgi:hypothetical protein